MLWFKLFLGLKIFKPIQFYFAFVSDSLSYSETKENKNQTGLKIFKPKKNFNHNIDKCSTTYTLQKCHEYLHL